MDWWNIITTAIALSSLLIVVYQEFLRGPRLSGAVDRICLMGMTAGNKTRVLAEMLVDDLLAGSSDVQALADADAAIRNALATGDRTGLRAAVLTFASRNKLTYNPDPSRTVSYAADPRLGLSFLSFYIPFIVHNSGKKTAHISSLMLITTRLDHAEDKWAFPAFLEVNTDRLIHLEGPVTDTERASKAFSGLAVEAGESVRVDPWFFPILELAPGKPINASSMGVGIYVFQVFGYGATGKRLLSSYPARYQLTQENLIAAFMGNASTELVRLDEHIADALKSGKSTYRIVTKRSRLRSYWPLLGRRK